MDENSVNSNLEPQLLRADKYNSYLIHRGLVVEKDAGSIYMIALDRQVGIDRYRHKRDIYVDT